MMRRMSAALERMTVSGADYASRWLWCRGKPVSAQNRHDRHASARKHSWVDGVIAPQYLQVLVAVTDRVAMNQHHLALEIHDPHLGRRTCVRTRSSFRPRRSPRHAEASRAGTTMSAMRTDEPFRLTSPVSRARSHHVLSAARHPPRTAVRLHAQDA